MKRGDNILLVIIALIVLLTIMSITVSQTTQDEEGVLYNIFVNPVRFLGELFQLSAVENALYTEECVDAYGQLIKECIHYDGCCPDKCTYEEDYDCVMEAETPEKTLEPSTEVPQPPLIPKQPCEEFDYISCECRDDWSNEELPTTFVTIIRGFRQTIGLEKPEPYSCYEVNYKGDCRGGNYKIMGSCSENKEYECEGKWEIEEITPCYCSEELATTMKGKNVFLSIIDAIIGLSKNIFLMQIQTDENQQPICQGQRVVTYKFNSENPENCEEITSEEIENCISEKDSEDDNDRISDVEEDTNGDGVKDSEEDETDSEECTKIGESFEYEIVLENTKRLPVYVSISLDYPRNAFEFQSLAPNFEINPSFEFIKENTAKIYLEGVSQNKPIIRKSIVVKGKFTSEGKHELNVIKTIIGADPISNFLLGTPETSVSPITIIAEKECSKSDEKPEELDTGGWRASKPDKEKQGEPQCSSDKTKLIQKWKTLDTNEIEEETVDDCIDPLKHSEWNLGDEKIFGCCIIKDVNKGPECVFGVIEDNSGECVELEETTPVYIKIYKDNDGDKFGGKESKEIKFGESLPEGYSYKSGDCDDNNKLIWREVEVYVDNDGDGYGAGELQKICIGNEIPKKYSLKSNDCDDNNPNVWQLLKGYIDNDNDGYGTGDLLDVCSGDGLPNGYSDNNLDADDSNADIGEPNKPPKGAPQYLSPPLRYRIIKDPYIGYFDVAEATFTIGEWNWNRIPPGLSEKDFYKILKDSALQSSIKAIREFTSEKIAQQTLGILQSLINGNYLKEYDPQLKFSSNDVRILTKILNRVLVSPVNKKSDGKLVPSYPPGSIITFMTDYYGNPTIRINVKTNSGYKLYEFKITDPTERDLINRVLRGGILSTQKPDDIPINNLHSEYLRRKK